jgi:hypothetical protein
MTSGLWSQLPSWVDLSPRNIGVRTSRPVIRPRENIDEYEFEELVRLIRWIKSDSRLRTDEEILSEAAQELGFKRRGVRIEEKLRRAIESA